MSCSREVRSVDVSGQASLDSHKLVMLQFFYIILNDIVNINNNTLYP